MSTIQQMLRNAVGEHISPVTMWNIVNQLGKHNFSCVSVVSNLKDRKFFLIKWVEIASTQFSHHIEFKMP